MHSVRKDAKCLYLFVTVVASVILIKFYIDHHTYKVRKRKEAYAQLRNPQTLGVDCQKRIDLPVFQPNESHVEKSMFFLETSGTVINVLKYSNHIIYCVI